MLKELKILEHPTTKEVKRPLVEIVRKNLDSFAASANDFKTYLSHHLYHKDGRL